MKYSVGEREEREKCGEERVLCQTVSAPGDRSPGLTLHSPLVTRAEQAVCQLAGHY